MTAAETLFEIDPPFAVLTFNRPQARNAMTWAMYDALVDACDEVDRDARIRVFILRGAGGKAFVSGTDISQFESFHEPQDAIAYERRIGVVLGRLASVMKPTIAQVEGYATGAGCGIVASCDLSVASADSAIGIPIARTLGNCVSSETLARMVSLIGPARAREMIFTGRLVPAAEAAAIGLINRVVAKESIQSDVMMVARQIAANAPLTIRATKEMTRRLLDGRYTVHEDTDLIQMCYMSTDFKEGVAAFLEKRRPHWTGA